MKCIKGYEIEVLHSAAGYYIGTFCKDGPNCRVSNYYKTEKQAKVALDTATFGRYAAEIDFCNNGLSCIPSTPPYILSYEYPDYDHEIDMEFDDLNEALTKAQQVEMEGGRSEIIDSNGLSLY